MEILGRKEAIEKVFLFFQVILPDLQKNSPLPEDSVTEMIQVLKACGKLGTRRKN
jgi:hypothetical protein